MHTEQVKMKKKEDNDKINKKRRSKRRAPVRGSACLTVSHFISILYIYIHSSTSCSMYQINLTTLLTSPMGFWVYFKNG